MSGAALTRAPFATRRLSTQGAFRGECTPFGGGRHEPRPPALEALPRHHAVLYSEQPEQHGIDEYALDQRPRGARIDRLRNDQITDETDRIQYGYEKHGVGADSINDCNQTCH